MAMSQMLCHGPTDLGVQNWRAKRQTGAAPGSTSAGSPTPPWGASLQVRLSNGGAVGEAENAAPSAEQTELRDLQGKAQNHVAPLFSLLSKALCE